MRNRIVWRLLPIFLLGMPLVGCSDDDGPMTEAAIVELGTGTIEFMPLADDDPLEIIAGPQGGHHFVVHARAQNIIPGDAAIPGLQANPRTVFAAFTEAGEQFDLMFPPYTLGYRRVDDTWFALPSGRILQVEDALVPEIIGQRVRLTVRVTDAAQKSGTDEVWVQVIEGQIPDNDGGLDGDAGIDGGVDAGIDAATPDGSL